jgi:hypothetical protein
VLDIVQVEQWVALPEVLVRYVLQHQAGRLRLGAPDQLYDLNNVVVLQRRCDVQLAFDFGL